MPHRKMTDRRSPQQMTKQQMIKQEQRYLTTKKVKQIGIDDASARTRTPRDRTCRVSLKSLSPVKDHLTRSVRN